MAGAKYDAMATGRQRHRTLVSAHCPKHRHRIVPFWRNSKANCTETSVKMEFPTETTSSKSSRPRRWLALRDRSERGASMVEYAILIGLLSVVVVVGVVALGSSLSGIFGNAANCVGSQTSSTNQTGQSILSQANSLMMQNNGGGQNQLSTGLQINGGSPPDSTTCAAPSGNSNPQNVLQLLQ